ncbi:F-box domain containing protein [Tanacetum coccineum]
MSDNIPFDIQINIMNRLPVKSLLQFRTVSKKWKFSIDNSNFIRNYGFRERNTCCFNLTYKQDIEGFIYSVDENLALTPVDSNLNFFSLTPIATSEGVWCFSYAKNSMLWLWNPSIKKSVGILVPNYTLQPDSPKMIFGFGVCPDTLDPTLLKINYPLYLQGPWLVLKDMPEQIGVGEFSPPYHISQLGNSLIIYAWALEVDNGFVSSYRQLFTLPHPAEHELKLLGFSKDKELVVEATIMHQWHHSLQVFKLTFQTFQNVGVSLQTVGGSFFIGPHKESLILLTERNNTII